MLFTGNGPTGYSLDGPRSYSLESGPTGNSLGRRQTGVFVYVSLLMHLSLGTLHKWEKKECAGGCTTTGSAKSMKRAALNLPSVHRNRKRLIGNYPVCTKTGNERSMRIIELHSVHHKRKRLIGNYLDLH